MTVGLDALIAEARNRGDALRTLFPNDGDIRDDARLYETLADALESTLAELRQEREKRRPVALRELMDAQAALSRARPGRSTHHPHRVRQAEGGREVNIEEEIAQTIEVTRMPSGGTLLASRPQVEALAAALMPLVKRVQAEAIREVADAWHAEHRGTRPAPYLFMVDHADRIENEGERA